MIDINRIRNNVEQIACSTGEFLKEQQAQLHQSDIELKGTRNFVTHIDTEAEKMLVEKLGELIPGATFLTEEGTLTLMDSTLGSSIHWTEPPITFTVTLRFL